MMAEEEEEFTSDEIDDAITDTYDDLMDVNHKIIQKSRRQAHRCDQLIELYAEQIQRLSDIRDLHIAGAATLSNTIGEILTNEWDLHPQVSDSEEEPDDGEGED